LHYPADEPKQVRQLASQLAHVLFGDTYCPVVHVMVDDSQIGAVYIAFAQIVHPLESQVKHFELHFVQIPFI